MTSLLAILALGFMLGMRHATDPDHVVAVTTIVSGHRSVKRAALIGAAWGLGHTLTILLVGSGIILFKWVIPPRVGLAMELAVAVMLILLGAANLTGTLRWLRRAVHTPGRVHAHSHVHGDYVHSHPHGHAPESHPHREDETPLARIDRRLGTVGGYRLARPLVVGIVHGLAGSAAVALLVLAAITTPLWSIAYLLIFGIGTIAGMMIITAAISVPFAVGGEGQFPRLQHGLRVASGLISLGFGLIVAYRIGIVDGLFAGEAHWTPR
jgi:ABC-type nickel/cobalt efflux system permease component RcnA